MTVDIQVTGLTELKSGLKAEQQEVMRDADKGLLEVGRVVQSEAKRRCPVSPTRSQADGVKGYNFDHRKSPNELTHSIKLRQREGQVEVGHFGGAVLRYASIIHDGQGKDWRKIGPGSKAKQSGVKVGGKYLDRAWDDNATALVAMFDRRVQ